MLPRTKCIDYHQDLKNLKLILANNIQTLID